MSATESIKTILILGATSGIGEAFARRFHGMGKKVIATGRREANLAKLKADCPGLETYVLDNSDLSSIGKHAQTILAAYPDINAVWVNSGLQQSFSFKDTSKFPDDALINEVAVNVTAPVLLAKHFLPHLQSLKDTESFFMLTSSGIAFVPAGSYPVYSATKAATHHLAVVLRQQFQETSVRIVEIAPPYVATELDQHHKEAAGGLSPMPLQEYTDETFKILDAQKGADLKEVAVGFADMGAKAWRGAFQPVLDHMQMGG